MDIEILMATSDDLAIILALQKECYQTEAALHNDYDLPPLTQTLDSINKDFMDGILFLKAVVDGQIIGAVRGETKGNTTYIGRLIVKKELQNKKIGQTLMNEIENRLDNCKRYELFTGNKSEKNLNMYTKLGYREYRRQPINDNLTLVFLEKWKGG